MDVTDLARVTRAFEALVPMNRAMGLDLVELGDGWATSRLPWDDRLLGDQADGLVHGGVLSALLDATCGMAAFMGMRTPGLIATLDLRVDHLRSAHAGQALVATAETVRATRQVLFVRGQAHHEGQTEPVAVATATFARAEPGGAPEARASEVLRAIGATARTGPAIPAPSSTPPAPPAREARQAAPFVERLRAARAHADLGALIGLIEAVPFAALLGIGVERGAGEALCARMRFAPHLVGNPAIPALHGGATAALLETAAIAQVLWALEPEILPRPITLTFDYLRSARTADVLAEAQIVRQGRRVCTVRVTAWQEDRSRPIAAANVTLLLV